MKEEIQNNKPSSFWRLILSILICEGVGALSGLISAEGINGWFQGINKPSWNPPSYIFGPVWTSLYLLMAISLFLVWNNNLLIEKKKVAIFIFSVQLFLNFCWSILFFKFHSPAWALVDIIIMIVTISITIYQFSRISKWSAILLVPYLCWVIFASYLNYTIWILN